MKIPAKIAGKSLAVKIKSSTFAPDFQILV